MPFIVTDIRENDGSIGMWDETKELKRTCEALEDQGCYSIQVVPSNVSGTLYVVIGRYDEDDD